MSKIKSIDFPEIEREEGLLEGGEAYMGKCSKGNVLIFVQGAYCLVVFEDHTFVTQQKEYCETHFLPFEKVTDRVRITVNSRD